MGSDDFRQYSVVFSGLLTRLRRPAVFVLLVALLIMLPGCAPKRMKSDFVGFEAAYAETSNREVLLNLARLQNHDPTYFFKIGQISSLYRMQASLTGSGSYAVSSSNPLLGGPAGGGTSLLNYENDPSFTFIPVNDQTNAQFLLQPIPAETFYALYQQGWRVDQLFRLMVDRIELTTVTAPGVCSVTIYRNQAPQVRSDGTFDAATLSSYVVFLRVSALLYALQKRGDLILSGTNDFVPYDTKSALKEDPPAPPGRLDNTHPEAGGKVAPTGASADSKSKTPSASDIVNALGKDAVWEKDSDGNWLLGQKVTRGVFYLNYYRAGKNGSGTSTCKLTGEADSDKSDTCRIATDLLEDKSMQAFSLNDYKLLMRVLNILASGFSISEPSSGSANSQVSSVGPCPQKDATGISSHLVMRSLVGIMASAERHQSQGPTRRHARRRQAGKSASGAALQRCRASYRDAATLAAYRRNRQRVYSAACADTIPGHSLSRGRCEGFGSEYSIRSRKSILEPRYLSSS
jgi:hypothetical protein